MRLCSLGVQATVGPIVPAPDDEFGAVGGMRIGIRQSSLVMMRARVLSHLMNQECRRS
jgi:hypothetical protein